jgi:hypothetical protein
LPLSSRLIPAPIDAYLTAAIFFLREALFAENRTIAAWLKRNFTLFFAFSANRFVHLPWTPVIPTLPTLKTHANSLCF